MIQYPKPPIYRRPATIASEIEDTRANEWSELITDLVSALRAGKGSDLLHRKIVEAGWSATFADFAIDWASGEVAIDEAEGGDRQRHDSHNPSDVDIYREFVYGIVEFKRGSNTIPRLLGDVQTRMWRPWEVVALDTKFRHRLCSALEASSLTEFSSELSAALSLIKSAGINKGGPRAQQSHFVPVLHSDGAIMWDEGVAPSGGPGPHAEQVRQNTIGLGRMLVWYAHRSAQEWLAGVERSGPVDLVSLTDILTRAEQNVAMANDSVAVLSAFRHELEPHARVVSVKWMPSVLKIKYSGSTPVGRVILRQMLWSLVITLASLAISVAGIQLAIIVSLLGCLGLAYGAYQYAWVNRSHVRQWWR